MNDLKCLSEQELSEFVRGRIDEFQVERIAEHIEDCDDCQATVVMLGETSDTFVDQLRSPAAPDALEAEKACQDAVERLADRVSSQRSGPTAASPALSDIQQVGPYRIQGELGVGGMGTVFVAMHTKLKRSVALKLLPETRWANPAAVSRFEREMEVIGQLDHPNIVRANDAGEENGMHYLVMEHVDGLDLSRVVNRVGPLAIADACEIARQAAVGLQYANENHLVHRDIKPSNLMLAASGKKSEVRGQKSKRVTTVKILDLGLALLGESHSAHENELTTVGQLMGTLDYMSPEQGMDSHEVDIRADIYSLGATLFKLLTGRAPFSAPQYNTLLKKVTALANKPVTPIQQLRPDIPDELAATIDRMLSKEPSERFHSPTDLIAALEPFSQEADLNALLATALKAKETKPNTIPPVVVSRSSAAAPLESKPSSSFPTKWIFASVLLALSLLAGALVLYVTTDNGVLIVRADDNAEVLVRRDGNTVRELEVTKGEHAVTVRSGAYRIELKGKSDELMMSQNAVTVKRGDRIVIQVHRRPKRTNDKGSMMGMYGGAMMMDQGTENEMGEGADEGEASGFGSAMYGGTAPGLGADLAGQEGGMSSMPESTEELMFGSMGSIGSLGQQVVPPKPNPTYDGKTYTQWINELQTERMPERLTEAIRAFASLGEDDKELATRSAAGIMQIMRRNGSNIIDSSPQGKLVQQALKVLLTMPSDIVIQATEDELREGNTRSRSFANLLLQNAFYGQGLPPRDFARSIERHRDSLYQLMLNLPDDEPADVRAAAISMVINRVTAGNVDLNKVEGLVPRLRDLLFEKDLKLVALAANALVKSDPDNEHLVPALTRLLPANNNHDDRVNAIRSLGRLGAKSRPAIDQLVAIIRPIAEPKAKSSDNRSSNAGESAGGGYGEMSGGFGGGMGGMSGAGYSVHQDIHYVTIEALGLMGPAAKSALPLLRKIADRKPAWEPAAGSSGLGGLPGASGLGFGEESGLGMGTGEGAEGLNTTYISAARTAINRIEGKEPIPSAAEQDEAAAAAVRHSGGYF